ncbi:DUF5675 family protein [Muricauda sp. MAR_2010_75]|uniref:DUF5675 family protein n=1 Tax=Allomuricauda sp. MAR_2010_75 TaxID=1250232 RepID=UPI00068D6710|nr:DUF5675 family protein [Muricauda sp. MAR_2010_75]
MYAVLNRLKDNDHAQTLGHFILYNNMDVAMQCKSLELPDLNNEVRKSRIPAGVYCCERRYSPKYKWHYWVKDVDGRTWILIHIGNYKDDTTGCILLGQDYVDIDQDGHLDVTASGPTMNLLRATAPDEFTLIINDIDKMVL